MRVLGFPLPDVWRQWQPSLTAHDPNPPITLEGAPAPQPPAGSIPDARGRAVQFLLLAYTPTVVVPLPAGEATFPGTPRLPVRTPGWAFGPIFDTTPPTFPAGQANVSRPIVARPAPPQVDFWYDPSAPAAAPIFGVSAVLPGRTLVNLAVGASAVEGVGLPLQFALPLPVVGLTPLPGRGVPARPVGTAASPGLTILSPFLEDAPVRTTGQTRPQTGPWRRVDILGPALTQAVAPPEYPTGQQQLLLPRRATPAVSVNETVWWMPPPVVDIPVGLSSTLPRRTSVPSPWAGYTPLPLFGEPPPPGGRLLALVRPLQTPKVGSALEPLPLLLGAVMALPPGVAGLLRPGTPARRAPGSTLTWLGYMPAPATVMPPGVVGQPRVPRAGRAAPVSPYLATYILQVPPAPFSPAEMWQFQDGPTLYTFGGTETTVWVFAAMPTVWEW